MSPNNMPAPDRAPTIEEIAAYIRDNGYSGSVSPTRFYGWYEKSGFMYRGQIMDWRKKIREWAESQKKPVVMTAEDYRLLNAQPEQPKKKRRAKPEDHIKEYMQWVVKQI